MKLTNQLIINLKGLGFEEVKPNLYSKQISENTVLYRDYRKYHPVSYAYFKESVIPHKQFKEALAIEKIEASLENDDPGKLSAYA